MMLDRLRNVIRTIVEQMIGPRLDYLARYPSTVVQQDVDDTLHLKPDDTRIPGLIGVPIRPGLPGAKMLVPQGCRVLLAFEGGNPSMPIAEVWGDGTPISIFLPATDRVVIGAAEGDDEARPIARIGDPVQCLMPPMCPIQGTLAGAPFSGLLTIVNTVDGIITGGASIGMAK